MVLVYKLMCNNWPLIQAQTFQCMYSCDSQSTQRLTMLLCDDFAMQESDSRIFVVITSPVLARAVLCKVKY